MPGGHVRQHVWIIGIDGKRKRKKDLTQQPFFTYCHPLDFQISAKLVNLFLIENFYCTKYALFYI